MGKFDSLVQLNGVIKKQKLKLRRKARKGSFLSDIWDYLTSDSYMYGPLLSKRKWHGPGVWYLSGTDRQKRLKRRSKSRSKSNSPVRILRELFSSPGDAGMDTNEPIQKMIEQLEEVSETGGQVVEGTFMTVSKTITTTTYVEQGHPPISPAGVHFQLPPTLKSADGRAETELTTELTEQDGDVEEENSWDQERHDNEDDYHDYIPLDEEDSRKVANQLIGGLGGRFSDDLGIYVDASDNEVERWFLAANFFCRSVSFDIAKKTYKEILETGVSKMADLVSIEDSRLAAVLEGTGYTKYGKRVASQLKKLATDLEENHWGRVSTFKYTADSQELVRQLRSIPGVTLHAARVFLRELRGVWAGTPTGFNTRTKRAALHLKLLGSINASSNPERVLSEFAHASGIDVRDLEVALFKLGTEHEQQYGECPGGTSCKVLLPTEKLVDLLPSDILL
ncbi:unnamed protein product [Calypogeia fissa]